MNITYDLLVKHKACDSQRKAFKVLYPNGCEPTVKNLANGGPVGAEVSIRLQASGSLGACARDLALLGITWTPGN